MVSEEKKLQQNNNKKKTCVLRAKYLTKVRVPEEHCICLSKSPREGVLNMSLPGFSLYLYPGESPPGQGDMSKVASSIQSIRSLFFKE